MSALDRSAARAVIQQATGYVIYGKTLDALEGCVRPAPQQTIDREALTSAVGRVLFNNSNYPPAVQPHMLGQDTSMLRGLIVNAVMDLPEGDSVTLTREEAAIVLSWYPGDQYVAALAHVEVAERLEAAL